VRRLIPHLRATLPKQPSHFIGQPQRLVFERRLRARRCSCKALCRGDHTQLIVHVSSSCLTPISSAQRPVWRDHPRPGQGLRQPPPSFRLGSRCSNRLGIMQAGRRAPDREWFGAKRASVPSPTSKGSGRESGTVTSRRNVLTWSHHVYATLTSPVTLPRGLRTHAVPLYRSSQQQRKSRHAPAEKEIQRPTSSG
jgi:hypothetical protein